MGSPLLHCSLLHQALFSCNPFTNPCLINCKENLSFELSTSTQHLKFASSHIHFKLIPVLIWTGIFVFFSHVPLTAQNLIPNPSFENFNDYKAQVFGSPFTNLYPGVLDWHITTRGMYSGVHSDSIKKAHPNDDQFYRPYHGQAHAVLLLQNTSSLGPVANATMQAKLIDSLNAGCYYRFRMYVLPEGVYPFEPNPMHPQSASAFYGSTKNIGAYFSKNMVMDTTSAIGHAFDSLFLQPQVLIPQNSFITDTTNYTQVSGVFKAGGGEQYITVGYFGWVDTMSVFKFRQQQVFGSNDNWRIKFLFDSLNLYQVPPPDSLLTASRDTSMCPGDTLQLFVNARDALNYQWDDNSTDSLRIITQPGTYYVDAFYPCGDILSDTIVVSAKDVLPPIAVNDTAICPGEAAHYKVPPGPVYTLNGNPVSTNFDISTPGQYNLTATNSCESDTFQFEISYLQVPAIPNIVIHDTALCEGEEMQITLPDSLSYVLNSAPVKQNPVTISQRNDYELLADNGCETRTFTFTVHDEGCETLLFVPNAFTPDSDGVNDCFDVSVIEQQSYHIMIFNRWGQMVFESTNPEDCWDGSHNGKTQAGVYTYRIIVKTHGREIDKAGMVQVVR